jgi:hypothetical protein
VYSYVRVPVACVSVVHAKCLCKLFALMCCKVKHTCVCVVMCAFLGVSGYLCVYWALLCSGMCVCVCVYVCMYIRIYMYTYIYVCVYIYIYICDTDYVCLCLYIHTYMHTYIHTFLFIHYITCSARPENTLTHTYIQTCTHRVSTSSRNVCDFIYMCVCMYVCLCIYTHIYVYI